MLFNQISMGLERGACSRSHKAKSHEHGTGVLRILEKWIQTVIIRGISNLEQSSGSYSIEPLTVMMNCNCSPPFISSIVSFNTPSEHDPAHKMCIVHSVGVLKKKKTISMSLYRKEKSHSTLPPPTSAPSLVVVIVFCCSWGGKVPMSSLSLSIQQAAIRQHTREYKSNIMQAAKSQQYVVQQRPRDVLQLWFIRANQRAPCVAHRPPHLHKIYIDGSPCGAHGTW